MRSRFEFKPGGKPKVLAFTHPAVIEGRTNFPSRVMSARDLPRVLIPGEMNSKIGGLWEKGWPGGRIFSLSLEERKTCPRTCQQWATCYMNHQRFTIRVKADEYLIPKLQSEIAIHASRFEKFSIRLHQSGDFFSAAYAQFWLDQVKRWPGLHCFGFTARQRSTPIGRILEGASADWDRFKVRFSGETGERTAAVMIDPPRGKHDDGSVTCPAESGDTPKCETCGLCLTTPARIVFKLH